MVTGTETLLLSVIFVFIALVFNILLSEDTIKFHPPPVELNHAFADFGNMLPRFLGLDTVRECSSYPEENYPANT